MSKPILYFLVTNSMHQDQRLQKICSALTKNNYEVHLVGIKKKPSLFTSREFQCHSIPVLFKRGPLFYFEVQLRFLLFLLFKKLDAVIANDLDTIPAAKVISKLRSKKLFIDLHEYFAEVPELEDKPIRKRIWNAIAKFGINKNSINYTVNASLAKIFGEIYNAPFAVVHNFPKYQDAYSNEAESKSFNLVYVGMINKGRGIKESIKAFQDLDHVKLSIYGDGDEYAECKALIDKLALQNRVVMKGFVPHDEIRAKLSNFDIGLNLLSGTSLNYYYSSANKFFDYTAAGVPSINMNFPEYQRFNNEHEVAILIDECTTDLIRNTLNSIVSNPGKLQELKSNCLHAKEKWQWNTEASKLVKLYNSQFSEINIYPIL